MGKSFEENIMELEQIVSKLENGNCGLDESIELYSKGLKLSAECKKQLDVAKQKIENIADYLENENV